MAAGAARCRRPGSPGPRPSDAAVARTGRCGTVFAVLACAALLGGGCTALAATGDRAAAPCLAGIHPGAAGSAGPRGGGRAVRGDRGRGQLQARNRLRQAGRARPGPSSGGRGRLARRRGPRAAFRPPPAGDRLPPGPPTDRPAAAPGSPVPGRLTAAAARSASLRQFRSFQRRLAAAGEPAGGGGAGDPRPARPAIATEQAERPQAADVNRQALAGRVSSMAGLIVRARQGSRRAVPDRPLPRRCRSWHGRSGSHAFPACGPARPRIRIAFRQRARRA
jgi:hypothetical protein